MTVTCALGVDPGGVTGLAVVFCEHGSWVHPAAIQCNAATAPALLDWLCDLHVSATIRCYGGIEEFRASRGPGSRGKQATTTRRLVTELTAVGERHGIAFAIRPAALVKPWGSDHRLAAAGLLAVTAGQPHARDAARHAVFAAVHDGGVTDPLSRRSE